jgi:Z1 domain
MTAENALQIEKAVSATLPPDRRPTEDEIESLATAIRTAFPVTDNEFEQVLRTLHAKLAIGMDLGTALVAIDYAPWLANRKAEIDPYYWERFRKMLLRDGRAPLVLTTLDSVTDDILDLTGDPLHPGRWARRGLVIGHVQSGKTEAYTALICKAADAGYRLIILLTGSLENLRRQTQTRLDEGFVGLDSSDRLKVQAANRAVGVGLIDRRRAAGVFTSKSRDFSKALMNQLGFRLDAFVEPVLVVLKKNKRLLENLHEWLAGYNAGQDGRVSAPLLLIDDEADSASINTAAEGDDPTKVNEQIRKLLTLFTQSAYVGFTATPFANVFIDPDSDAGMLGDDLFPKDFIYALESPSNYWGSEKVFGLGDRPVWPIEDAEPFFPSGHRADYFVPGLPESLIEAVRSFVLATTIRDLRQQVPPHRSMLVNVSSFTRVQDQVATLIEDYLRALQRDIRNFAALDEADAMANPSIASLQRTWETEFREAGFTWREVQLALPASTLPIVVKAVNQRTGAASLDYRDNGEQGLRVIAVGGNSLSRGLTLEGLTTSYFYRHSQMYDTLLQMGRWFGYRDGYEDVCRIWMTEETQGYYAYIAQAADELRAEVKRMRRLDMTPRDFGLKVRSHPDALLVTATNKMRRSNEIVRDISLDDQLLETSRLRSAPGTIRANADTVTRWLDALVRTRGAAQPSPSGVPSWTGVSAAEIADLLSAFETHPLNTDFQSDEIAKYLRTGSQPILAEWDVALPGGSGSEDRIGGESVRHRIRKVVLKPDTGSILVNGANARVGSPSDERDGLSKAVVDELQARYAGKTVPGMEYRHRRSRPLLLIHAIDPVIARTGATRGETDPLPTGGATLFALGLSFPPFDDRDIRQRVIYRVNLVGWRSLWEHEAGDDFVIDDELD